MNTFKSRENVFQNEVSTSESKIYRHDTIVVETWHEQNNIIATDTTVWVNDSVQTIKQYAADNPGFRLFTSTTYRYDENCMVKASKSSIYNKKENGQVELEEQDFDVKNLNPIELEARKKHGHLAPFYATEQLKVLSADKYGNPTKIVFKHEGILKIDSIIYQYYK